MMEKPDSIKGLLGSLQERAKELNCLYRVDEALSLPDSSLETVGQQLVEAIPPGWQYPSICRAKVTVGGQTFKSHDFRETKFKQEADIVVMGEKVGRVSVLYTEDQPVMDEGPFLKEERRLINAIADRVGLFVLQRRLRSVHQDWQSLRKITEEEGEWFVILDFLRRTDPKLLAKITRKMINQLSWVGVEEAKDLLEEFLSGRSGMNTEENYENWPRQRSRLLDTRGLTEKCFRIASFHFSDRELVSYLHSWLEEEKSTYLIDAVENPLHGLTEIAEAMSRFQASGGKASDLPLAVHKSICVSLLRRLLSDQFSFVNAAKDVVKLSDFIEPLQHIIHPPQSYGKMGGKSAGIFLASRIIASSPEASGLFKNVKYPKTWYISSDTLLNFMHYNNLEDLYNRKYLEIERIRQEYPYIVQVLKNSHFPPEIVRGLSVALDDFEDHPIIVRSSSLLEDREGSAFSGKYKSLFLANQGTKKERLEALQDAVAEVYSSIFSPDPIQYRAERGLLDVHEEMGILIQEVVGKRVGKYFMPAFSGVAFSNNEFRWSARIKREDGLIRIVPGLGTRAVDRISDDYPVLIAPGQPGLRVNVTPDEVVRYAPTKMDVIDLEENAFETVNVEDILKQHPDEFPAGRRIVSIVEGDRVRRPVGLEPDWEDDEFVVTFQGLISDTPFVSQVHALIKLLRTQMGMPVDIEFASDGENFYLLQCRAQSFSETFAPAPIPRDLPRDRIIFSANKYVSNGRIPDTTHIVYVDPDAYSDLSDIDSMREVGRAVGALNRVLPKHQFVLLGPGRWGSRGDIKLGVNVTYSDINNSSALLEIARKKGGYVPELSFGTHFFQDLVEANIRYVPLYPDEPGVIFNEPFLRRSKSILADIVPQYDHLADVIRVIDVPSVTDGKVLRILMNADINEAVGLLASPSAHAEAFATGGSAIEATPEEHWRWRLSMAENIAAQLDPDRFGVKAMYVFGSTKNSTAGPGSDVDLLVHLAGAIEDREELELWLDGWSRALAEINYLRTGYRTEQLLDVHWITDQDIEKKTSFAAKIGAVTDAARPLPMGTSLSADR
jgi:hypothetical protein